MRKQDILQTFLFVVFFAVGASALSASVLIGDLLGYYRSRQLLKMSEQKVEQLKALNADYDALLQRLREDPNLVDRIAPVTFGTEPSDRNAIYPRVTAEQLMAAKKALEEAGGNSEEVRIPDWLIRCREQRRRISLFLAGACLILISFVCFTPQKYIIRSARDID